MAKYVAHYMLHKDGALWGRKIEAGPKDYFLTYHQIFHPKSPVLFYPLVDLDLLTFSDDLSQRELNLIYFGKGPPLSMEFDGKIPHLLITRTWPQQKDLLVSFLQSSRYFHTSDAISTIVTESLLCGAAPVIHHLDPRFSLDELITSELPEAYQMHVEQDYSVENTLRKSLSLRERVAHYQSKWLLSVERVANDMKNHFS